MSLENVKNYFKQFNLDIKIQELPQSSATVKLAAAAIGCEPQRIAKSLAFAGENNPILIVTSGDTKIDNAKFKAEFKIKAKMLTPEQTSLLIGHTIGGVCPFATNKNVAVYLDISLKRFNSIFPACGSSNSVIELSVEELEKHSKYK